MSEVQGDYIAEQPVEGGAPPPQEPPAQEKVSQPEAEAPRPRIEQKRAEIYDRIRQRREWEASEAQKDRAEEPEPQQPQQEPQQQQPAQQAETPADRRFKLRVNHQDHELTEQEMIAAAQQHLAYREALPEVKQLRAELAGTLAQLRNSGNLQRQDQSEHQPPDQSEQAGTRPQETQLDLRKVVSEIQLGDEDSGTEALESLVDDIERRILAKQGPSKSSDEITRDAMAGMKSELIANALTSEFQSRHPEIYRDRRLGAATVITLNDLCLQEMRSIGVAEEHLQAVQREPEKIADWHRQYRERGFPVSDPLTLADAAANYVKGDLLRLLSPQPEAGGQQYQQPQPQTPAQMQSQNRSQARVSEKRAEQSNNPRRANTVQRVMPQAPKSTADIVADMRARRKFAI